MSRFVILRNGAAHQPAADDVVLPANELGAWATRGGPFRTILAHQEAAIVTPALCHAGRPFAFAILARLSSRGPVYMLDESGERQPIAVRDLMRWAGQIAVEPIARASLVRAVRDGVDREFAALGTQPRRVFDPTRGCAFLRTDLSFGVKAGGSVGHIAGVINNLQQLGLQPIFVTTDRVPTVDKAIETHLVCASERFWSYRELPTFVMDDVFGHKADDVLRHRKPGFIYQRHSLNNFVGVRVARQYGVPLVVEYNGSEIWVSRHWSARALAYGDLSRRIEDLNFAAADLIVVVSDAIQQELAARGVSADKVLVNPNGVDVDAYSPAIDGSGVRARHGLGSTLVFGFIGTFGVWHGADVLAEAYNRLIERRPDLRDATRLLFIGDGPRMARVRAIVDGGPAPANVVFAGLVPQADGPAHLAACDVLVSPHVPNSDGTPFFGSPTKLFEYMAMGRAIVASDLDQVGQVLAHGDTAWLVTPGDPGSLHLGMERVADDADLRRRLGDRARSAVVARHSWRRHTRRIIDALTAIAAPAADRRMVR
jgi:glycosyltransferase involved in cell wall biosynthesis